jgi:hypothetical protein
MNHIFDSQILIHDFQKKILYGCVLYFYFEFQCVEDLQNR